MPTGDMASNSLESGRYHSSSRFVCLVDRQRCASMVFAHIWLACVLSMLIKVRDWLKPFCEHCLSPWLPLQFHDAARADFGWKGSTFA